MKLYKVTLSFDVLVASPNPRQALRESANAAEGEAASLTRARIRIGPCAAFDPVWQTLPAGWLYTDHPVGSSDPVSSWVPQPHYQE